MAGPVWPSHLSSEPQFFKEFRAGVGCRADWTPTRPLVFVSTVKSLRTLSMHSLGFSYSTAAAVPVVSTHTHTQRIAHRHFAELVTYCMCRHTVIETDGQNACRAKLTQHNRNTFQGGSCNSTSLKTTHHSHHKALIHTVLRVKLRFK